MLTNARLHTLALTFSTLAGSTLLAQSPPTVVETGVVLTPQFFTGVPPVNAGAGAIVLRIPESQQGADLNGDGDLVDSVAHLVIVRTGALHNLGHATAPHPIQVGARAAVFVVDEAADGGVDHDGDGSALGRVLFVHDLVTGVTNSLGIAAPVSYVMGSRYLATIESEAGLGLGDVNGDGVISRTVVLRDLVTGNTSYVGPYPEKLDVGAGRIVWNGGTQITAFDEASGARFTLPRGSNPTGLPFVLTSDFVAFRVNESAMGPLDLNGDGDTWDQVTALILRGVDRPRFLDVRYETVTGAGAVVAFAQREGELGADLNGDGDTNDKTLSVYDARSQSLTNLPIAVLSDSALGMLAAVADGVVAFGVPERNQGQVDLDGDGDTLDVVAHAYDVSTGTTSSSGLAIYGSVANSRLESIHMSAGRIGLLVSESDQEIDLNGNGYTADLVAHVWSPFAPTPAIQNLGQCVRLGYQNAFALEGNRFAMCAREEAIDSNGDGDTTDTVVRVVDVVSGTVTETGLVVLDPSGPPPFFVGDGFVVFAAKEGASVGGDSNGDFDLLDYEAVLLKLKP